MQPKKRDGALQRNLDKAGSESRLPKYSSTPFSRLAPFLGILQTGHGLSPVKSNLQLGYVFRERPKLWCSILRFSFQATKMVPEKRHTRFVVVFSGWIMFGKIAPDVLKVAFSSGLWMVKRWWLVVSLSTQFKNRFHI